MKQPIFYYKEMPHQHFEDYNVGPCHPHPCPPPVEHKPHYHGKVSVIGRTVLTVKYVDRHGHYQTFDLRDGETYEITAVSSSRGICTFAGRIVDFECNKGIEKLIDKPHEITISALIVDYSDAYESKLLRIYINNIISIKPIKCFDGEMNYPVQDDYYCHPEPPHKPHHHFVEEDIYDPFDEIERR